MRGKRIKLLLRRLVLACFVVLLALPTTFMDRPALAHTTRAPGAVGPVSVVMAFGQFLSGTSARNRVYEDAKAFGRDKRVYYDRLHEKALEQLRNREIAGLRDSQVAAYVKVVLMIEQEREAMIGPTGFAESEKRAAKRQFGNRTRNALGTLAMGTGKVQRLVGAVSQGLKSAHDGIGAALSQVEGGEVFSKLQKVRRVATYVNVAGRLIGGKTGDGIRKVSGRIVTTIDRPTEAVRSGVESAQEDLTDLREHVHAWSQRGQVPNFSQATRAVGISLITGERDPALEAVLGVIGGRASRDGPTFRERAREKLQEGFVARCTATGAKIQQAVARLLAEEGDASGGDVSGDDPSAFEGCQAIDLDELVRAVDEAEQAQATEAAGTVGAEATPTPAPSGVCATAGAMCVVEGRFELGPDFPKDSILVNGVNIVFPVDGGSVSGDFLLSARIDFSYGEETCVERHDFPGTLSGNYDPASGMFEGSVHDGKGRWTVLAGCEDIVTVDIGTVVSWWATYDAVTGHVVGAMVSVDDDGDEGEVMFEGNARSEEASNPLD